MAVALVRASIPPRSRPADVAAILESDRPGLTGKDELLVVVRGADGMAPGDIRKVASREGQQRQTSLSREKVSIRTKPSSAPAALNIQQFRWEAAMKEIICSILRLFALMVCFSALGFFVAAAGGAEWGTLPMGAIQFFALLAALLVFAVVEERIDVLEGRE
jgi:hypothetical protein